MSRNYRNLVLFFIGCFIILIPGFYNNQWNVVVYNPDYQGWQIVFDRAVVARLVKSRQDGLRSDGGLLGLGDVKKWKFDTETTAHQFKIYEIGENFDTYLAYESFPGFQGLVFGVFDRFTNISPTVNLIIFRGVVVVLSAIVIALFSVWLAIEFGWLAAIFPILFILLSEWMTLPAGSIYWNLWAFYLPFVTVTYLLAEAVRKNEYQESKILIAVFSTALTKILFNGFEAITSAFIMITVPLVYFAVRDKWKLNIFVTRMMKLGVVLMMAIVMGLAILSIQIAVHDKSFSASYTYIWDTLNRRAIGNPKNYPDYADGMRASVFAVIWKYLDIPAMAVNLFQKSWQVTYLQLNILFVISSVLFFWKNKFGISATTFNKGRALIAATWYSITAPLSWFIIFKPTSFTHDAIFPIVWQMPFTLLGFAVFGYLLQNLCRSRFNIPET